MTVELNLSARPRADVVFNYMNKFKILNHAASRNLGTVGLSSKSNSTKFYTPIELNLAYYIEPWKLPRFDTFLQQ